MRHGTIDTNRYGRNFFVRFKKAIKKAPKVSIAFKSPNMIIIKGERPKKFSISHIWSVERIKPKVASTIESAKMRDSIEAATDLCTFIFFIFNGS